MKSRFLLNRLAAAVTASLIGIASPAAHAVPISGFHQTNLTSDIPGLAAMTDPEFRNPLGIAHGGQSPFFISLNGSGQTNGYVGNGTEEFTINIPNAAGTSGAGTPTGAFFIVGSFRATGAFYGDTVVVATEDGIIAGAPPKSSASPPSTADILFNNSATGAVYTGIAGAAVGTNLYLYAANFSSGKIDVFKDPNAAVVPPDLTGTFPNPAPLGPGYAPFDIQAIGGKLYVTYALQDAARHDAVPGAGRGYVVVYDVNGNLLSVFASDGVLNAPWGIVQAPTTFGSIGNDILIGNFGDGLINVFNPVGAFLGTLADGGAFIHNDGLWALTFGSIATPGNLFDPNALYLTAGLNGGRDGLLARIDFASVPEPSTLPLFGFGLLALVYYRRRTAGPNP